MPKNPTYTRTEGQREEDLVLITDLYTRGYTLQGIAEAIEANRDYTLSVETIRKDIKQVRERWQAVHQEQIADYLVIQLTKLDRIEAEYWEAWEKSKQEQVEETKEANAEMYGGQVMKVITKIQTTPGDAKYLQGIERCIDRRAKLLGLYKEAEKPTNPEPEKGGFTLNLIVPQSI